MSPDKPQLKRRLTAVEFSRTTDALKRNLSLDKQKEEEGEEEEEDDGEK